MLQIKPGFFLAETVQSNLDRTTKYVFLSQGQVVEFSYIDKQDGKDIICAPTQTACNLGCKFCFLSDYDFPVRNLTPTEIFAGINYIIDTLHLCERSNRNNVLLVSFMGCGEPLCNLNNVMDACDLIRYEFDASYRIVRFAIASLIPTPFLMQKCITAVTHRKLPVKFHLSLHSPFDEHRQKLMPSASPVKESVELLKSFKQKTGNAAEIHYALIAGINDRDRDISELVSLFSGCDISIKFLAYNEKPNGHFHPSERVAQIRKQLEEHGIQTEYYVPPGSDIGSSCGQFLMKYYLKHNTLPLKKKR